MDDMAGNICQALYRGAALVFAHGRVARALLRERSAAASVAERAMTDAREEVAAELHRRDAELSALRTNIVLHKIELRQQALQELATVRGEARVKMLAMLESAAGGGGGFKSDKLMRIANLEDAMSELKMEKGELEAGPDTGPLTICSMCTCIPNCCCQDRPGQAREEDAASVYGNTGTL